MPAGNYFPSRRACAWPPGDFHLFAWDPPGGRVKGGGKPQEDP
jgi:hypothetical protein